ncbi:hypothetical protein BD779DRAFT_1675215 [Infundibulicybe gibba]|nr:hypothetical protein BD779DRAFT_1675215 [Infundibulicybe gibba]
MHPARALPDIGPTFGAVLIGGYASLGLFGVLTLQCWLYYTRFPNDLPRIKLMVVFLWVVEFLRSCFMVHAIHHYTVVHWGDPSALLSAVWSLELILLTTFIVEFVVHLYFAYRVWIISGRRRLMTSIICFFTISNLVIGICEYAYSIVETKFSRISGGFTALRNGSADLRDYRRLDDHWVSHILLAPEPLRIRIASTNTIINRLVFYAINRHGSRVLVLVSGFHSSAGPHLGRVNLYYLALFEIVGNLYANSLLASLNARTGFRQQANVEYLSSFNFEAAHQSGTLTKASTTPGSGLDGARPNLFLVSVPIFNT